VVERRYVNVRTAQSTDRKPFIRYFLCKWTYLAFISRLLSLFVVKKSPLVAFTSLSYKFIMANIRISLYVYITIQISKF
jgi:hypothetical protein